MKTILALAICTALLTNAAFKSGGSMSDTLVAKSIPYRNQSGNCGHTRIVDRRPSSYPIQTNWTIRANPTLGLNSASVAMPQPGISAGRNTACHSRNCSLFFLGVQSTPKIIALTQGNFASNIIVYALTH